MPKMTKTCRVCGKTYECCRTTDNPLGVFRWRDVACSPECGAVYLARLNAARGTGSTGTEEASGAETQPPAGHSAQESGASQDAEAQPQRKKPRDFRPSRQQEAGEED